MRMVKKKSISIKYAKTFLKKEDHKDFEKNTETMSRMNMEFEF